MLTLTCQRFMIGAWNQQVKCFADTKFLRNILLNSQSSVIAGHCSWLQIFVILSALATITAELLPATWQRIWKAGNLAEVFFRFRFQESNNTATSICMMHVHMQETSNNKCCGSCNGCAIATSSKRPVSSGAANNINWIGKRDLHAWALFTMYACQYSLNMRQYTVFCQEVYTWVWFCIVSLRLMAHDWPF